MMFLISTIAFIVLLTGLILIHEFGHFLAAKKSGVVVEEFGFGLPPRVKTFFTWQGTIFSLNWIPFGGFVRLKGENALEDRERRAKGSFGAAPIFARCVILIAGVLMNFLLALILLTGGFTFAKWIPTYTSLDSMLSAADRGEINLTLGVYIDGLVEGGTAEQAGLVTDGILSAVDGEPVRIPSDVVRLQEGKRQVTYTILRGKGFSEKNDTTVRVEDGKTGVMLSSVPLEISAPSRNILDGFLLALRETKVLTYQTIRGIGHLVGSIFMTGKVPEGIAGIVGIAQLTHHSVQEGFAVYLRLVALLSLSLAVLNILPFPALDGGRLLFVLIEAVFRRPLNRQLELIVNTIGFGVLILLILFVTFFDVIRLFT